MTVQLRSPRMTVVEPMRSRISSTRKPRASCPRCGIIRTVNHSRNRHSLCIDCRSTEPQWPDILEVTNA